MSSNFSSCLDWLVECVHSVVESHYEMTMMMMVSVLPAAFCGSNIRGQGIIKWAPASVCLSVCCLLRRNSRSERARKPKIGRMEAHYTRNMWTYLEVNRSKIKVTRPINAHTANVQYFKLRLDVVHFGQHAHHVTPTQLLTTECAPNVIILATVVRIYTQTHHAVGTESDRVACPSWIYG